LPRRPLSSPTSIDPNSAEARRNETALVRPISTACSNFLSPSSTKLKHLFIPVRHCRYVNGVSSMFPVAPAPPALHSSPSAVCPSAHRLPEHWRPTTDSASLRPRC